MNYFCQRNLNSRSATDTANRVTQAKSCSVLRVEVNLQYAP